MDRRYRLLASEPTLTHPNWSDEVVNVIIRAHHDDMTRVCDIRPVGGRHRTPNGPDPIGPRPPCDASAR